jgi:regulator of protease activity HflC (stomatin/prohibitin superfamily)
MLTELGQAQALEVVGNMTLQEALALGIPRVCASVEGGLVSDPRIAGIGISVVAVRVVGIRAEPEVERALQMPAREQVQQEADRATFERRALAVERERAIEENELTTRIELARREEQLIEQRGQNERRRAQDEATAARILAESEATGERLRADAHAEATRVVGRAEADAETAKLAAYREVEPVTLFALAAKELAGNLPAIGALTVAPDLLTSLAGWTAGDVPRLSGGTG